MDGLAAKLAKESGLRESATPATSDLNGLDPREVVDIRFFLEPQELDEAVAIRKVASNTKSKKILGRVICGIGTVYFGLFPYMRGTDWSAFWNYHPASAFFFGRAGRVGFLRGHRTAGNDGIESQDELAR